MAPTQFVAASLPKQEPFKSSGCIFFSGVWYYSLAQTLCDITSDLQVWQKEGGVHLKCAWALPFGYVASYITLAVSARLSSYLAVMVALRARSESMMRRIGRKYCLPSQPCTTMSSMSSVAARLAYLEVWGPDQCCVCQAYGVPLLCYLVSYFHAWRKTLEGCFSASVKDIVKSKLHCRSFAVMQTRL